MPVPGKNESKENFIERCIPVVLEDGTAEDSDQAVAVCNSIWNEAKNGDRGALIMGNGLERRFVNAELRVLAEDAGIEGYAAVFNQYSEDLGGFIERIRPGAFKKTIQEADVRALFNHDPNYVLGRNQSGTLALAEDDHGLYFEVELPKTGWAQDLRESISRGDVDQASFGFSVVNDKWEQGHPAKRELIEVKLFDVSVVTYPAYPQTQVSARSLVNMFMARLENGMDPELIAMLRSHLDDLADGPGQEPHPAVDHSGLLEKLANIRIK